MTRALTVANEKVEDLRGSADSYRHEAGTRIRELETKCNEHAAKIEQLKRVQHVTTEALGAERSRNKPISERMSLADSKIRELQDTVNTLHQELAMMTEVW